MTALVKVVANMVSEWDDSEELATELASRVVDLVTGVAINSVLVAARAQAGGIARISPEVGKVYSQALEDLTKPADPPSSGKAGAPGTQLVTSEGEFIAAVAAELRDHFRWSPVEGTVGFEAETIATAALRRLRDVR